MSQVVPGLYIYRFSHSLYYANVQQFSEEISQLVTKSKEQVNWICLDASGIDDVDFSAAEVIRSLYVLLREHNIRLVVAQLMDDVEDVSRYELRELFGQDAFYTTFDDVLTAYQNRKNA